MTLPSLQVEVKPGDVRLPTLKLFLPILVGTTSQPDGEELSSATDIRQQGFRQHSQNFPRATREGASPRVSSLSASPYCKTFSDGHGQCHLNIQNLSSLATEKSNLTDTESFASGGASRFGTSGPPAISTVEHPAPILYPDPSPRREAAGANQSQTDRRRREMQPYLPEPDTAPVQTATTDASREVPSDTCDRFSDRSLTEVKRQYQNELGGWMGASTTRNADESQHVGNLGSETEPLLKPASAKKAKKRHTPLYAD